MTMKLHITVTIIFIKDISVALSAILDGLFIVLVAFWNFLHTILRENLTRIIFLKKLFGARSIYDSLSL